MFDKDLELAKIDDPDGIICGHCGNVNDFADDIGFWYVSQEDIKAPLLPCCLACWNGEVGRRDIERYGLGER